MSSTPRGSAKPAAKPKAKKKAPAAPIAAPKPVATADLSADDAKAALEKLQKEHGALVVTFNNQQEELKVCQERLARAERQLASYDKDKSGGAEAGGESEMEKMRAELRALETNNMALQKKVNKLQVEHVSEEEVDQLFYALEQKEQQLEDALAEKAQLEGEVLTARQMSARGGGVPTVVEIHHHNNLSDDEDSDGEEKPKADAA